MPQASDFLTVVALVTIGSFVLGGLFWYVDNKYISKGERDE